MGVIAVVTIWPFPSFGSTQIQVLGRMHQGDIRAAVTATSIRVCMQVEYELCAWPTRIRLVETEILARQGLRLPAITLKCLRTAPAIYCQPSIPTGHQHLAKKASSGASNQRGAVAGGRRAGDFVDEQGSALPWLQRVDSIGGNRGCTRS